MSRTTLYKIDKNHDVIEVAEFGNAWRSAPMLWDYLMARLKIACDCGPLSWGKLWDKATHERNQERMTDAEWWAYTTTMDRQVVDASCTVQLMKALRDVQTLVDAFNLAKIGSDCRPASFSEQADAIDAAANGVVGWAWNQTSVSSTWPMIPVHSFDPDACDCQGTEDEDRCSLVPQNTERDGGYWLVTGMRTVRYVEPKHAHARIA